VPARYPRHPAISRFLNYSLGNHTVTVTQCNGKQRQDVENPPNGSEENQVFGKPSVGVKTKEMRNCE
jgi:hypothetical protein